MRWPCALGVALVFAGGFARAAPTAFVATGDVSPLGLPFSHLSGVAIDERGRVAFLGSSAAIFRRGGSGIEHIIGAGDRLGDLTVAGVGEPAGRADCFAARAIFVGGRAALLRRCGGSVERLTEVGAPVADGVLTSIEPRVVIDPTGSVAFTGQLDDGSTALLMYEGGVLQEVTRTGAAAPAGGTFTAFHLIGASRSGRVGFRATVSGGRDGLYAWDRRFLTKVAVVGDASPAGGRFTAFGGATFNDNDAWVFHATVSGRGVSGVGPVDGIFRADASTEVPTFAAVVLVGEPSPIGGRFAQIPAGAVPTMSSAGVVAFRANVVGGESEAAVFVSPLVGSLLRLVQSGDSSLAGRLATLRDPVIAADDSVLLDASLVEGTPGLFVVRGAEAAPLALLGETTDLGGGFRFSAPVTGSTATDAVFLGTQEGVYVAVGREQVSAVATLAEPTPIGATYAGFDPPAAGRGRTIVFGADMHGGRVNRALFTVGRRGPVPLVAAGADVPGGGRIDDLLADPLDALSLAGVGPGRIAFHVWLTGGADVTGLVVSARGRLWTIARAGDVTPLGGRYTAFGTPAVLAQGRLAFLAAVEQGSGEVGLFVRRRRETDAVAVVGRRTGTRVEGRFARLDPPEAQGKRVVFRAELVDGEVEAIFVAERRKREQQMVAIAATGDLQPDGGRLHGVGTPTVARRTVVFPVTIRGGTTRVGGLYGVGLRRNLLAQELALTRPLVVLGEASPLGGTFLRFGDPKGNDAGEFAFVAELTGATASSAIFVDVAPRERSFP